MAAFVERWVFQTSVLVRMTFLPKIPLQISFSKNWTRKETNILRQGTFAQKKISHHYFCIYRLCWLTAAVSQIRCNNGCMNRWKSGYSKFVSLKSWNQQNPFLSLKIQASSEIILFETVRTDHQTQTPLTLHVSLSRNRSIALYVSSLQDDHLSIKRYGMKRSTSCTFAVLLHPTTTHLASFFSNYFPSLSPQKHVNMRIYRITVFWIWRDIRPSTHAPLNSVVNQNGGVLT